MPLSKSPSPGSQNNWKIAAIVLGLALLFTVSALVGSVANRRSEVEAAPAALSPPPATIQSVPSPALELAVFTSADTIKGKVVGVADGDTITVLDDKNVQHKIRLEGIDAPESMQAFGEKAKQNLSALVFGKAVEVVTSKKDKYGRSVGKVIADGTDVNLKQLKDGFAWHYKEYEREQSETDRKLYADAETSARAAKTGLWFDANPTAPWNWRHGDEKAPDGAIIVGNKNSSIYHWAGCPGFNKIGAANRVVFETVEEAETAGYRAARNCSTPAPRSQTETGDDENAAPRFEAETIPTPVPQTPVYTYSAPAPLKPEDYRSPYVNRSNNGATANSSASGTESSSRERAASDEDAAASSSSSGTASALCADGTYSYSANRRGTCSHHGGVARWLGGASETEPAAPTYSAPDYSSPSSGSGGTVQVRGYYRKDGTFVRPHTRRAPRR